MSMGSVCSCVGVCCSPLRSKTCIRVGPQPMHPSDLPPEGVPQSFPNPSPQASAVRVGKRHVHGPRHCRSPFCAADQRLYGPRLALQEGGGD